MTARNAKFRQAAWTYLVYGIIYWVGRLYLQMRGLGPGRYGAQVITLPETQTFGLAFELPWEEAARVRLEAIPSFARGIVVKAVEAYAQSNGHPVITPELMAEIRQKMGTRFQPQS